MVKTPNIDKYKSIKELLDLGTRHKDIVNELNVSYSTIQAAIKWFETKETIKEPKKTPISKSIINTLLVEINKLLAFAETNRLHKIGANIKNALKTLKVL